MSALIASFSDLTTGLSRDKALEVVEVLRVHDALVAALRSVELAQRDGTYDRAFKQVRAALAAAGDA